jgi:translation initiation factor IF-1
MKTQIENELGQTIKIVKEYNNFIVFDCEDGTRRTNKLTKTGKHKKNSIRVW